MQLASPEEVAAWLASWESADGPFQRFLLCAWRIGDHDGDGHLSLQETKRMAVKLLQGTSKVGRQPPLPPTPPAQRPLAAS